MTAIITLVLVALAAWPLGAQDRVDRRIEAKAKLEGVSQMDDTFTRLFRNTPFAAPVELRPIRPLQSTPQPAPRAPTSGDVAVIRWGVADELNGRIGVALPLPLSPDGKAAERVFKSPLPPGLTSQMLLTAGNRIAAAGGGRWALLETSGHLLAEGTSSFVNVLLDPPSGRWIAGGNSEQLEFHAVSNGALDLAASPLELLDYSRTFIGVRGSKVALVSQQMDTDVHAGPVERSMIEIIDLAYNPKPMPIVNLVRKTNVLQTAMHGDTITLATINRIYFLDFGLKFLDAWSGEFRPLGISLDELSNVYMLVRTGDGVMLWKLSAGAQRVWEVAVPSASIMIQQPPIVGFDHTVYLVTSQQIAAVAESGKILWERKGRGRISGAFVAANDMLVLTEGSQISAFNLQGDRQLVHDCEEELVTPPIITADGSIYAASRTNLFRVRYP